MYPLKPFEIEFPNVQYFEAFWLRLATQEAQQQLTQILITANNRVIADNAKRIITDLLMPKNLDVAFRGRSCYIVLKGDTQRRTGMVLEFDNPLSERHPTWVGYITLNEDGHFERVYAARDLDQLKSCIIEMVPQTPDELARLTKQLLAGKLN